MSPRELFGGAIVAQLPAAVVDVSTIRQVPDNQEVFLYRDSNVSIVVEVLQRVPEPDAEAVKFHFDALAHDNDAISSAMQDPLVIHNIRGDETPSPITLRGFQRIRKSGSITPEDVDLLVALFRVNSGRKSADILVSASIPRDSMGGVGGKNVASVASEFDSLVSSLRIVDYDLFADSVLSEPDLCPP